MIFFLFWISSSVRADLLPINWREGCRQKVSGYYLVLLDKKTSSLKMKKLLSTKTQRLRQEISIQQSKNIPFMKSGDSFDAQRYEWISQQQDKIEGLQKVLEEYKNMQIKVQKQYIRLSKQWKLFHHTLKFLFSISSELGQSTTKGYTVRIQYKQKCPKYKRLCLLTVEESEFLKKLRIDQRPVLECLNYSNLRF